MQIVTLLSDFGTEDGYPGAMKGVILARAPGVQVVDITHAVPRYDVAAGAFALAQAAPMFPAGTVHVAVVDPGVGTARRAVVACDGSQVYVGPDNGLLCLAVPAPIEVYEITEAAFMRAQVSATFHGRDIFAAAAGRLAAGAAAREAGPALEGLAMRPGAGASPSVAHVDGFGNLVTNVAADTVARGDHIKIAGRTIAGVSTTFAAVDPGRLLAYIGSGGTLEIAVREGSAAELLRVGRGTPIEIERNPS